MKLKQSFVTQEVNGTQIMVSADSAAFGGVVRSNAAAAFIVDCLKEETSQEKIIAAMLDEYDAPREVIERDVEKILGRLRGIGALDE